MKDRSVFSISIVLLIVAIILCNVFQDEALTVPETCQIVKNNTYVADPADCQGWALCRNGVPSYGKCGTGLLYNSATGYCDYPAQVQCSSNVTTMCTGLTDVYKAHPYDCQSYCYCKDSQTYTLSCPTGQYYDPVTTACIWSSNSKCSGSSPCILCQNGFIKDSTSCTGWIRCAGGQVASTGACAAGYYYNALSGECDYKANVPCSLAPGTVPGSIVSTTTTCTKTTVAKQFVTDGQTCRGYFYCATVGNTGAPWGQCPLGSQFSPSASPLGQCTDPDAALCPFDRCQGVTKQFMTVVNTNCKNYTICNNGVSNGANTGCPTLYPYFNEVAGVCQETPPTFAICTTTVVIPK